MISGKLLNADLTFSDTQVLSGLLLALFCTLWIFILYYKAKSFYVFVCFFVPYAQPHDSPQQYLAYGILTPQRLLCAVNLGTGRIATGPRSVTSMLLMVRLCNVL